jgi:Fe-S-cluster-containing dehydrogenase component
VALIRSGFARLSQKFGNGRRTLNYLGAGRFYGFREIAHNWRQPSAPVPLQYTLSAVGCANVILIPTRAMEDIVLPGLPEEELPPLFTAAETRADTPSGGEAGAKISEDMLGFLAEQRFFNGTAAMLIDLDRCTRCDDCVRACAAAHNNNPRFLRHGPIQDGIMVANACMHCADPVCMIGCPTGAIHRNALGGEVIINKATCIGCSVCANQCPYEAIRMVEIRDEEGRVITDAEMAPLHKATKCDLCFEQWGGPACERACPHDALARINMNDLDGFARWLKR